jgi:hypothetical protein
VAEAARFVDEEFGWVGFVDEDQVHDDDGALDDAGEVLGPAPAERRVGDKGG